MSSGSVQRRPSSAALTALERRRKSSAIGEQSTLSAAIGLSLTAAQGLTTQHADKHLAKEALSLVVLLKGAEQIAKTTESRQHAVAEKLRNAQSTIEALQSELAEQAATVARMQADAAAEAEAKALALLQRVDCATQTELSGQVCSNEHQTQLQTALQEAADAQQKQSQQCLSLQAELDWERQQRQLAGNILEAARQQELQAQQLVQTAHTECELKVQRYKHTNDTLMHVIDRLEKVVLAQQKCIASQRAQHYRGLQQYRQRQQQQHQRQHQQHSEQQHQQEQQQRRQQHQHEQPRYRQQQEQQQQHDKEQQQQRSHPQHEAEHSDQYRNEQHADSMLTPPPAALRKPQQRSGKPPLPQRPTSDHASTGAAGTAPTVDVHVSCSWPPAGTDTEDGTLLRHGHYTLSAEAARNSDARHGEPD